MKLYYDKPESLSAAISGERRGIMNKEILFRAKRIGDGKWFEGYYCGGTEDKTISPCIFEYLGGMKGYDYHNIILDTLGQFTGLTDIHGVKIFEGDIIKQYEKTQFGDPVSDFGLVKWDNKECMLFRTSTRIGKDRLVTSRDIYEVVGNIYDNPDLLEVSDNG